jgi:hypothetical protein
VKFLKRDANRWFFQLGQREKPMLLEVLALYPVLDSSLLPLSKSADPAKLQADQKLLEEALASQREENARKLHKIFGTEKRFSRDGPRWHLTLNGEEIDMLLQVLNDIRVGSWRNLGCPDPQREQTLKMTDAASRSFFAMEMSGHFEMCLLKALDHDTSAD